MEGSVLPALFFTWKYESKPFVLKCGMTARVKNNKREGERYEYRKDKKDRNHDSGMCIWHGDHPVGGTHNPWGFGAGYGPGGPAGCLPLFCEGEVEA